MHPEKTPNLVICILAGGAGTRLRPFSTDEKPKQFHKFFGPKTLLQDSFLRIADLVSPERILVLTQETYQGLVEEQLPEIPVQNILKEPMLKDTAAAISLASFYCKKRFGESLLLFLPSDHLIKPKASFQKTIYSAVERIQNTSLIYTFGIKPEYPATQYGYLHCGEKTHQEGEISHYQLLGFCEKPNGDLAKTFVESGDYFWNSGIFLCSTATILKEIKEHLPEHFSAFSSLLQADFQNGSLLKAAFARVPKISIDYGILEKTKSLAMASGYFLWSDLGSFEGIERLLKLHKITLEELNPELGKFL